MAIEGQFFPPGSGKFSGAALELSPDDKVLRVLDPHGAVLAEAPRRAVKATSRLGALHRRLDFPGGARFETPDNDGIDPLLRAGILHRLEQSWRMVLAGIIIAAAATAWFLVYGAPLAADFLARHTPAQVSVYITRQTLETIDNRVLEPTTLPAATQRKLRALFAAIASRESRGTSGYNLLLRSAPLVGPNAFALPDGSIVLTDQLARMIRSDDEIEGVFAHEMSHVNHAHALQRVYQASLVPAAIAFITGDVTQIGHFATILPGVLLQSAYSRQFETEADDDAARLLRRMGKDPAALAGLLERMERKLCGKDGCGPSWLGGHPATAARASRLRGAR